MRNRNNEEEDRNNQTDEGLNIREEDDSPEEDIASNIQSEPVRIF